MVNNLGVGQRELDGRCAPVSFQGRRRRGLQPLSRDDQALFQAVLRGEHTVHGFRNGEVAERLSSRTERSHGAARRSGRVSRRISLLHTHGLVAKYPRSRRYRVTHAGQRFMSTAIIFGRKVFLRRELGEWSSAFRHPRERLFARPPFSALRVRTVLFAREVII